MKDMQEKTFFEQKHVFIKGSLLELMHLMLMDAIFKNLSYSLCASFLFQIFIFRRHAKSSREISHLLCSIILTFMILENVRTFSHDEEHKNFIEILKKKYRMTYLDASLSV
jgi:hypothetical protein